MIHPSAIIRTPHIGPNTDIWQFVAIQEGSRIGDHCNINAFVGIDKDVEVGDHVTLKSGTFIGSGVRIHDHVFVGPYVCFVNDRHPRSRRPMTTTPHIVLEKGCTIGAQVVIMEGLRVGRYAMVGAGSVVTKDVPAFAMVTGRPARRVGWVDEGGFPLVKEDDEWVAENGERFIVENDELRPLDP